MLAVAAVFSLAALLQPPLAQISRRDATAAALAAAFLPAVRRANAITPEEEKIRAEAMQYAYAELAPSSRACGWSRPPSTSSSRRHAGFGSQSMAASAGECAGAAVIDFIFRCFHQASSTGISSGGEAEWVCRPR